MDGEAAPAAAGTPSGAGLLRLLAWMSPAFPIGAFGWSHGLETAIAEGRVADAAAAQDWIAALLAHGSGWNDLVLFAASFRAARTRDEAALADFAELGLALAGSRERRAETLALGEAFAAAAAPWGEPRREAGDAAPYPIAVAQTCAHGGIPLGDSLLAFAHAFAANLLSVAVRLVPLGQAQATATLHALEPVLLDAAARAAGSTLDDLGQAALWSDIAAMRHETLQPRLFRS